jgi:hypothetical protein
MSIMPRSWAEARSKGGQLLWLLSRLHILSLLIGACLALLAQFLTGFWDFRDRHQALISAQYEATVEADKAFEEVRRRYETVLFGEIPNGVPPYSDVARDYIQSIEALQNLLPSTLPEFDAYVRAIANLQKFYGASSVPVVDSLDATIFYGEYRLAYDAYVVARNAYLASTANETGSYFRFLLNS